MLNVPVTSKLHIRRAVEPVECLTPAEALARFLARSRRPSVAVVRPVAPACVPAETVETAEPVPFAPPAFWGGELESVKPQEGRDWIDVGRRLTCDRIARVTAAHYGVAYIDLISARRTVKVSFPRQVAMYLAKTLTTLSLPQIGNRLGGRDHTTILHGVRKIAGLLEAGHPGIAEEIEEIKAKIGAYE